VKSKKKKKDGTLSKSQKKRLKRKQGKEQSTQISIEKG
jgi:hypothetical protein